MIIAVLMALISLDGGRAPRDSRRRLVGCVVSFHTTEVAEWRGKLWCAPPTGEICRSSGSSAIHLPSTSMMSDQDFRIRVDCNVSTARLTATKEREGEK